MKSSHQYSFHLFIGIFLLSFSLGQSFRNFLKGNKTENGCSIVAHPNITWIWEVPNDQQRNNSFYMVIPLDETPYIVPAAYPEEYEYEIPQKFMNERWQPHEVEAFYAPFPQFKTNYSYYFNHVQWRYKFLDNLYNIPITRTRRWMAIFKNVYTTDRGLIVNRDTCEWVRNGGCVYMFQQTDFTPPTHKVEHFKEAVSLTTGASGTWHFPMEVYLALAAVPRWLIEDQSIIFHLPRYNHYIQTWMTMIGVDSSRLKHIPTITADTLYVPQMGRCIEMYETQFEWLQKTLAPSTYKKSTSVREILFITRSGSRRVANQHTAIDEVKKFAATYNYSVTVHDDQKLPTLQAQIETFARVPIVVAPHGAGLLFTVFSPINACIMEFMPGIGPECYSRIAYVRRLAYHMYILERQNYVIDDIIDGLTKCHRHFEKSQNNGAALEEPKLQQPQQLQSPVLSSSESPPSPHGQFATLKKRAQHLHQHNGGH